MAVSPGEKARRLRQFAGSLRSVRDEETGKAAKAGLSVAYRYSSGTLSYADLARLDHPYATWHGGAFVPGDTAIINAHSSGADSFFSGWRIMPTESGFALINASKVAGWLLYGTSKMIARPIDQRIFEQTFYQRPGWAYDALNRRIAKI